MRQLETFPAEAEARAVADAMYGEGIETTVSASKEGGHALWVHDDDRLDEARALLARFRENPKDPRFIEGAKLAREQRRETARRDRETDKRVEVARRDLERRSGTGTVTLFIVLTTVGVWVISQQLDLESLLSAIAFASPDATTPFESIARGEVWRLITPSFLVGNVISLLFGSLMMLALGNAFEQRHRSRSMILLALAASAAANAFTAYSLGPGAVFSLTGVEAALFMYLYVRHRLDPRDWDVPPWNTTFWIPAWFLVSLVVPSYRPFAYMDVAGFAVGAVAAFLAARLR